jgi:hypothetical protein
MELVVISKSVLNFIAETFLTEIKAILCHITLPISALPAGLMQHPFYTGQDNRPR